MPWPQHSQRSAGLLAAAALASVALGATACSGSSSGGATHTSATVASDMTALATSAANAQYTAIYVFHQQSPSQTANVKVWHAPGQLRVDVSSPATTATLIVTSQATYSCSVKQKRKTCFKVAGPGQTPRAPFNVGPATLFTGDLDNLAAHGTTYTVLAAGTDTSQTAVTGAAGFAISPGLLSPTPQASKGTYCFAQAGLLTSVTFDTGNTARVSSVVTGPPTPSVFKPYAKPSPLPS